MDTNKQLWISSHVFYDPKQLDFLLLEGIKPFVIDLKKKDIIAKFFFIKYREHGYHIRLRLKAKDNNMKSVIKEKLESHFENFFKEFPSERYEPKFVKDGNYYWYPNNSIYYFDYVQEIDRYGGELGILIAEDHFEFSSIIVLDLLRHQNQKRINYEKKLALSSIINLMFVKGLGFSKSEVTLFFKFLYNSWLPLSFRAEDARELDEDSDKYKKFKKTTLSQFENSFMSQKDELVLKMLNWWDISNMPEKSSKLEIKTWINNSAIIHEKFNDALKKEQLRIPDSFHSHLLKVFNEKEIEGLNTELWFIYQSFIHMNNNRIGLRNRDEAYVNYLLFKSLNHKS